MLKAKEETVDSDSADEHLMASGSKSLHLLFFFFQHSSFNL